MSLSITKVIPITEALILLFLVPIRLVVKSKAIKEVVLSKVTLTKSLRRVSIESSKVRSGYRYDVYYRC